MPITTRFLIVGTYRTGSSALVHALNLHPRIACGLEWTQKLTPRRSLAMAAAALSGDLTVLRPKHQRQMQQVFAPSKTALGFKRLFRASDKWLFSPAFGPLIFDGLEQHIRWLARHSDIRVIHIVRKDHLAWLKSKALADATGKYSGTAYPENMEVYVSPREALRRVKAKTFIDEQLSRLRETNPYLRIEYEAFAADNNGRTREMAEFLRCLPAELPFVDLTRRIQSRASHNISNLEDLRAALAVREASQS
jgi:hypothetical protein